MFFWVCDGWRKGDRNVTSSNPIHAHYNAICFVYVSLPKWRYVPFRKVVFSLSDFRRPQWGGGGGNCGLCLSAAAEQPPFELSRPNLKFTFGKGSRTVMLGFVISGRGLLLIQVVAFPVFWI